MPILLQFYFFLKYGIFISGCLAFTYRFKVHPTFTPLNNRLGLHNSVVGFLLAPLGSDLCQSLGKRGRDFLLNVNPFHAVIQLTKAVNAEVSVDLAVCPTHGPDANDVGRSLNPFCH